MSSIDTYSTTSDLVFDEFVSSYRSDELRFKVFFRGCFFFYPLDYVGEHIPDLRLPKSKRSHEKAKKDVSIMSLEELIAWEQEETQSPSYLRSPHDVANGKGKVVLDDFADVGNGKDYPGGQILDLRLPRSTRMSYKEMIDLLLDKTKDDIWKWFYCKPKCKLEKGLTLVENDRDHKKMFELANFHGYLDVYVGHNPQVILLDYLLHGIKKKSQSPSYLRSPHVWKQTSASTSKGKVVLDDIKDVANGKGKVVLDDFADVGNGKGGV
ncbi:hypothetical protein Tco_0247828 [Tanacetum coccineum]